jgi:hypothetical protein
MKRERRQHVLPAKREAFTAILRFMTKEDVQLTVDEEKILTRWIFCDALLRNKKSEDNIIQDIADNFSVSVFTARNDIYYTQQLFAKSRQLIKKYLIHQHLERIDKDLEAVRKRMFEPVMDGEGNPKPLFIDAKELSALAKLHEVYTYTLNSIPEETVKDKMPPPIFQFTLPPNQVIQQPLTIEDAMKRADDIIMKENSEGIFEADDSKK